MSWLAGNWAWILLMVAFFALHLFGHGHGGHRHGRRVTQRVDATPDAHPGHDPRQAPDSTSRRRHGC